MLAGSPSSYAFHDSWLMTGCNNVACPGWGGDTRAGDADAGPSMINKYCDLGDTETRHYNVTPDLLMWPLLPHNQPLWARCGDTHPWWPCCLCGEMGDQIFSEYWLHLPRPASYFVSEINDHLWNWSFVSSVQCSSSSSGAAAPIITIKQSCCWSLQTWDSQGK